MGFDPMILRLEGVRVILTTLMDYFINSLKLRNRPYAPNWSRTSSYRLQGDYATVNIIRAS